MITLYKIDYIEETKEAPTYDGKSIYRYLSKVEQYTPIRFPDSVFTYYGWTTDYRNRRIYRYYGTKIQQDFLLDNTLDSLAGNFVSPDEWLSHEGNFIEYIKFGSLCPFWENLSPGQRNKIQEDYNPSNDRDNIWLMSYRQSSDAEIYLVQFTYDKYNDVRRQELLPPRKNVNLAPGADNMQSSSEPVKVENPYYEYYEPQGDTPAEQYEDYKNHYLDYVLSFDYTQSINDPSWYISVEPKRASELTKISQDALRELRCIEINLYDKAFDVDYNRWSESTDPATFHRVDVYFSPELSVDERNDYEDDLYKNVEHNIYVKINCKENVNIPKTADKDYLQINFVTNTFQTLEDGTTAKGVTFSFGMPLTKQTGYYAAGTVLYSIIYRDPETKVLRVNDVGRSENNTPNP